MSYVEEGMDSAKWYYLKSGRQRGPMDAGDLQGLLQSGALPPCTMVWTASQKDWLPANASAIQNSRTATGGGSSGKARWIALLSLLALGLAEATTGTPSVIGYKPSNRSLKSLFSEAKW